MLWHIGPDVILNVLLHVCLAVITYVLVKFFFYVQHKVYIKLSFSHVLVLRVMKKAQTRCPSHRQSQVERQKMLENMLFQKQVLSAFL